jgi:hypothetical protein
MSKVHDLVAADLDLVQGAKRKRGSRKPSLSSVAKQVGKANIAVKAYEVKPDGTVVAVLGEPEASTTNENPWNEVLKYERH